MKKQIGWLLLLLACVLWIIVIIIPFSSFQLNTKALLITGCIIVAEMMFWLGAVLVGKKLWHMKNREINKD